MKKLANYLELQNSLKKKPDTRANCMEILLMNPDTLEKFTEDDLADARNEVLRKSAKMPKNIGGGVTMGTLKSSEWEEEENWVHLFPQFKMLMRLS
jgi:hypothetical protein